MTGKSKYSDKIQRTVVELIGEGKEYTTYLNYNSLPIPSQKTLSRWYDTWNPVIKEEIRQDKIRQEQTRKRQHKPAQKKVRQDEKSTFSIPIRFLSDVEEALNTHLSAYNKSKYGAAVRRRERIHTILEIIKEVDN